MFVRFGPTPAHEEPSNFWLTRSQRTIVGIVEPKIDDRAYGLPQIMAISVGMMMF